MSQDVINRALGLAKRGLPDDGIGLVRPLLTDPPLKASALMAMAYCYETKGDLATAVYLYGVAIVLDRSRESWHTQLERCRALHEKRVAEVKRKEPAWRPFFLGLALTATAAVTAYAALPGIISDLLDGLLNVQTTNLRVLLIPVSLVVGLVGMLMVLRFSAAMIASSRRLAKAIGADYFAGKYTTCESCNLRYAKKEERCTFCGAPRVTPQPQVVVPPPSPPSELRVEASAPPAREEGPSKRRTSWVWSAVLLGLISLCAIALELPQLLIREIRAVVFPLVQPTEPPGYISDLVAYKAGPDGLIVYFVLADAQGSETTSDGTLSYTIWYRENKEGLSDDWQIYRSDTVPIASGQFHQAEIGVGAFARKRWILSLGRLPCTLRAGKVTARFLRPDTAILEAEERFF